MNLLLLFALIMATALGALLLFSWRIPVGYEDESAFRFGEDDPKAAHDLDDMVPAFMR